jgi:hypothetical protein
MEVSGGQINATNGAVHEMYRDLKTGVQKFGDHINEVNRKSKERSKKNHEKLVKAAPLLLEAWIKIIILFGIPIVLGALGYEGRVLVISFFLSAVAIQSFDLYMNRQAYKPYLIWSLIVIFAVFTTLAILFIISAF